jgi:hypothetical protein
MEQNASWEGKRLSATQEIPRISWNPKIYTTFTSTRITDIPEPKCLVYRIYSFVCALRHHDTISLCNMLLKILQTHHNTEYSKEFSIVIKFACCMGRSVAKEWPSEANGRHIGYKNLKLRFIFQPDVFWWTKNTKYISEDRTKCS